MWQGTGVAFVQRPKGRSCACGQGNLGEEPSLATPRLFLHEPRAGLTQDLVGVSSWLVVTCYEAEKHGLLSIWLFLLHEM